jgi:hypothetical protein
MNRPAPSGSECARQTQLHQEIPQRCWIKDTSVIDNCKRGDGYLRKLLVHGARSLTYYAGKRISPDSWLSKLMARRHINVAVVAQANKTARTVWAILVHGREFRPDYALKAAA